LDIEIRIKQGQVEINN